MTRTGLCSKATLVVSATRRRRTSSAIGVLVPQRLPLVLAMLAPQSSSFFRVDYGANVERRGSHCMAATSALCCLVLFLVESFRSALFEFGRCDVFDVGAEVSFGLQY
jgi:hypothetical protein